MIWFPAVCLKYIKHGISEIIFIPFGKFKELEELNILKD